MTIQELIKQRREMLGRMTPGPWEFHSGQSADGDSCDLLVADITGPGDGDPEYAEVLFGGEIAEQERAVNWDGLATLRNDAEKLWALVEALVAERMYREATAYHARMHPREECSCKSCERWRAYDAVDVDAALAALLEDK